MPDTTASANRAREGEAESLAAAVAALASFQQVTVQGDGKANMLLAVHVGLTAVLATQLQQIHDVPAPGRGAVALWVVSAVFLVSFFVDGYLIAQVIRPRRAAVDPQNPLGLSAPAQSGSSKPHSEHVWEMARALALVAEDKNVHVRRAVNWTATMVVSAMVWLSLVAVTARR